MDGVEDDRLGRVDAGGNKVNTGGVYDPATDTWTATTTTGAPSARSGHTAVWTGTKMVVWGGYDTDYTNTGGIYDPSTDTWTATTTTNAAWYRSSHTAVWTGSRMVVWGGNQYGAFLNTGGVYDPDANAWATMTTTGAPVGRFGHAALWTGSKMIVWGGTDTAGSTKYYNTGGLYDPASNTWTATSTAGAPSARAYHGGVWTGSKMIVWGGSPTGSAASTRTRAASTTPGPTPGAPPPRPVCLRPAGTTRRSRRDRR